jgi:CheY-like chemotaxis protein
MRRIAAAYHPAHGGATSVLHQPTLSPQRQVLIVDGSEDTREVLCTALQRRGVPTLQASGARQGVELARQHHPQVIVLDSESEAADDEKICNEYEAESRDHQSCLVVLGRARFYDRSLPKDRIVPKPYHFAPLIRTIERLLASTESP